MLMFATSVVWVMTYSNRKRRDKIDKYYVTKTKNLILG
jgi:hypothetical protein